jgi:hypothetical protein
MATSVITGPFQELYRYSPQPGDCRIATAGRGTFIGYTYPRAEAKLERAAVMAEQAPTRYPVSAEDPWY